MKDTEYVEVGAWPPTVSSDKKLSFQKKNRDIYVF